MSQCRSSGVKTANAVVFTGQCRLVSVHAVLTGTADTTIKVFDNTAASGLELVRLIVRPAPAGPATVEFDMHGVLANNGLYLSISSGSGEGAAVSVEFN